MSTSRVIPAVLEETAKIKFRCYKGISCFNDCCRNVDMPLTPYDLLCLKSQLGISSAEVLEKYTLPYEMDSQGVPGVKMKTDSKGGCLFLEEGQGCSIYENRPTACRYYPVAMLALKSKGEPGERQTYSLVTEEHCEGHEEEQEQTIQEYRKAQGLIEYDEFNRDFYQLILKKRSAGPTVGRPSETSLQLFFMACYDIDRFKKFVGSEAFQKTYQLERLVYEQIERDDLFALQFSMAFLKQVLFGERSIDEQEGAWERRVKERQEIWELKRQVEMAHAATKRDELMREVES